MALLAKLEASGWAYDDGRHGPPDGGLRLSECYPYTALVGASELGYEKERPVYKRKPKAIPASEFKAIPLDPDNVTTRFADLTERLGLGRRRFKSLRHSCATTMLANGTPLEEVISQTLGHAGLDITAKVYAWVQAPAQREAADRIQEALGTS